jgi:hypothetical protein
MTIHEQAMCMTDDPAALERVKYFARQLVTPEDLYQDTHFMLEKLKRLTRFMFGWGVVCGVRVRRRGEGGCELEIEPGVVLDEYGNQIVIPETVQIDLCKEGINGSVADACGDKTDLWCSDIDVNRAAGETYYLAVKYDTCETRPVKMQAAGCGCDDMGCEYSRIRESYSFRLLDEDSLPASYRSFPNSRSLDEALTCTKDGEKDAVEEDLCGGLGRSCPPCHSNPWVILADIRFGASNSIENIDCFAHRRYVASFGGYYAHCSNLGMEVEQPVPDENNNPDSNPSGGTFNRGGFDVGSGLGTGVVDIGRLGHGALGPSFGAGDNFNDSNNNFTAFMEDSNGVTKPFKGIVEVTSSQPKEELLEKHINTVLVSEDGQGVPLIRAMRDIPDDHVIENVHHLAAMLDGTSLAPSKAEVEREIMTEVLNKKGLTALEGKGKKARKGMANLTLDGANTGVRENSLLGKAIRNLKVAETDTMSDEQLKKIVIDKNNLTSNLSLEEVNKLTDKLKEVKAVAGRINALSKMRNL